MSFHRRALVITGPAKQDLRGVLAHTEETWGTSQADEYESAFNLAFEMLSEHPDLGRLAGSGRPDWRIFVVRRHCIVYRYSDATLWILSILHQRMNIAAHLERAVE
jgi:toxin ParE1/3/4